MNTVQSGVQGNSASLAFNLSLKKNLRLWGIIYGTEGGIMRHTYHSK